MSVPVSQSLPRQSGFTLLELLIVIAILSMLAGVLVEGTGAVVDAQKKRTAPQELDDLAKALSDYYYDVGAFPAALTSAGFYGAYVLPGYDDNLIKDEWGAKTYYRYVRTGTNPDVVVVYGLGPDAIDSGPAAETWKVTVFGAGPGMRRTRERLQRISAAIADHVGNGGTLSGSWPAWVAAMALAPSMQTDGFNTSFRVDADGRTVRSAGPDRTFDTADDLTL